MNNTLDMILHCPKCHLQHIDKPDQESEYAPCVNCTHEMFSHYIGDLDGRGCSELTTCECSEFALWTNPPHSTHLCRPQDGGCGHLWRPANINTNGVKELLQPYQAEPGPAECYTGDGNGYDKAREYRNKYPAVQKGATK